MDLQSVLKEIAKPKTVEGISEETGQSVGTVKDVIETALPLIIGQVGKNTASDEGNSSLNEALDEHSDSSILDTLSGLFTSGKSNSDGLAILGHIFGNKQDAAADQVSKKTGVDMTTVMQILSFITPLVLAYLAKKRGENGDIAKQTQNSTDEKGNQLMDIATAVLDKNKDGNIVDDLLGGLGNVFGKK